MRKVTIEDISQRTGLSRGTVSRAMNNRPDISHATRQRVLQACRELNYAPSHAARSLATGRHFAVAALLDDLDDPFATGFLRGALAQADAAHYAIQLLEIGRDPGQRLDRIRTLADDRLDGVLLVTQLAPDEARLLRERIRQRVVTGVAALDGAAIDVFAADEAEIGRLIARFLIAAGGQAVFYLHDSSGRNAAERLSGFQEVWDGATEAVVAIRAGESAAVSLGERSESVRAVVVDDDRTAVAVMLALAQARRRIGEDVAVLGVGNDVFGERISPRLSSIDPGGIEAGRRAFDALVQRAAECREDQPVITQVAPRLIVRESTRNIAFG
jgi:DNA-binding LacI/PurR family transcriptional regulator